MTLSSFAFAKILPLPDSVIRLLAATTALLMTAAVLKAKEPPKDVDDHYVSPAPKELPKPKAKTSNVLVSADGLKDSTGQVCFALFSLEGDFPKVPFRRGVAPAKDKKGHVLFTNIPHGTYALAVFHDRNKNFKLDTNFVGVPTERYGFSNNARGTFGPPEWKAVKFTLDAELASQTVTVK
ncbi:MAG: DUF2141 domain-containing protein [Opitutales bacterium]